MDEIEIRLGELQRALKEKGIPLLIIFEGPSAAGRGRLISKLIHKFDPRGYKLVTGTILAECDRQRLPLQKYWINTPENGSIAIFERSPYGEILSYQIKKKDFLAQLDFIKDFERTLAANGTAILKIFLDIDRKEQKKRLRKLEKKKNSSWRVTEADWEQNKHFDKYIQRINKVIFHTDTNYAPWLKIDSNDINSASLQLCSKVADFIEERLSQNPSSDISGIYSLPVTGQEIPSLLDNLNLKLTITREDYEKELECLQKELLHLELEAYRKRIPVIIVFEGCDAAGKGGAIRRLTQGLDPRGFNVIPVAAPDQYEKKHHYLWRFWRSFPKKGHFVIFDRSWYGRVLVERVENFCKESEWQRAYQEINEMEKYLSDSGAVVCKFWLQISLSEQLFRFKDRQEKEYKNWKITDEDWRNREKWPQYKVAVEEMLWRTSTDYAPWTIVEAESKLYSRIKILSTISENLKKRLK